MKIDPKAPTVSTPVTTQAPRRPSAPAVRQPSVTPTRSDSVQWSQEARSAFSPERLVEIRDRVSSNYYDNPAVAERVARRLIASGDL